MFIDLQHIGSTAVPGLCAKPVIDILAGVESMAIAASMTELICASGYTTSAEFNATLLDRRWFMRWANGRRTHHLHVVVHDGQAWHERLRFCNAMHCAPSQASPPAELDGPQDITIHGRSVAVVVSRATFERLSGQMASLVDFMQASPLVGLDEDLVFERDTSLTRDLPL